MEDWRNGGFGLYIHWPFCQAKCPYCDFNSHVAANIDQTAWERAYLSEIERVSRETSGRVLNTVFFGGGTPSMMDPDLVESLLSRIRASWPMSNDAEITLEANPTSVEAGRFKGYREAGVNRISMGIQSLRDDDLRRLGRLHTVAEARAAFEIARNTFDRVSFDLIYARQGQSVSAWRAELREALSMALDHLSLYQLTIEAGTAFGDRYDRGMLKDLPTDDAAADMYFVTQEECAAAGMPAYEISNHARPGAESRHNLIYWRYGDYAGIGPGAHGRLTLGGEKYAIDTPLSPALWLDRVSALGHGEQSRDALPGRDQAIEYLMMGLRIREGVALDRLNTLYGKEFPFENNNLFEGGFLETENGRLLVTEKGRPLLNAIIRALIPDA
ncbi:radical SAM family heme chaperone HemW [Celeribacter indicus]|uniref:Heme chaperone HemW n=1 Tax=Celeribacter indicus TaxID=1208324 RepID=A0A0B5DUM4_9RHOB|nr:radical SAM family heme chaperone HemW [Celeribacter indicus]AJE44930.1 coproporphyrinogen III oxidase [Celeribacter indicus]